MRLFLIYAVPSVCYILSTLGLSHDTWDSVSYAYSLRTGDWEPSRVAWTASGGHITFLMLSGVGALGVSWSFIFSVMGVLAAGLGAWSLTRALSISGTAAIVPALFLMTSPIFSLVRSSIFGILLIFIGLGLLGLSLILMWRPSIWGWVQTTVGVFLLIFAAQLQSVPVLVSAAALAIAGLRPDLRRRAALTIAICAGAFLAIRFGLPRTGLYADYNEAVSLWAMTAGFFEFIWRSITLYVEPLVLLAITLLILARAAPRERTSLAIPAGATALKRFDARVKVLELDRGAPLLAVVALCATLGAIIPYAVVDKVPTATLPTPAALVLEDNPQNALGFRALQPYNLRHLLAFVVCFSLAIGALFALALSWAEHVPGSRGRLARRLAVIGVAFALTINVARNIESWRLGYLRDADAAALVEDLRSAPRPDGVVWISRADYPFLGLDLTSGGGTKDLTALAVEAYGPAAQTRLVAASPDGSPTPALDDVIEKICRDAEAKMMLLARDFACRAMRESG